jgi:hypothetical protein
MRRTPVFRPADEAAKRIVWAATATELKRTSGRLYMRRKQLKLKGAAADLELARELWRISEIQTGIDPQRSWSAMSSARRAGLKVQALTSGHGRSTTSATDDPRLPATPT